MGNNVLLLLPFGIVDFQSHEHIVVDVDSLRGNEVSKGPSWAWQDQGVIDLLMRRHLRTHRSASQAILRKP